MAWIGVDTVYSTHFDPSNYSSVIGDIHVIAGLIILIMMVLQIIGGIVIDRMYDPARTSIPILDKVLILTFSYPLYVCILDSLDGRTSSGAVCVG